MLQYLYIGTGTDTLTLSHAKVIRTGTHTPLSVLAARVKATSTHGTGIVPGNPFVDGEKPFRVRRINLPFFHIRLTDTVLRPRVCSGAYRDGSSDAANRHDGMTWLVSECFTTTPHHN